MFPKKTQWKAKSILRKQSLQINNDLLHCGALLITHSYSEVQDSNKNTQVFQNMASQNVKQCGPANNVVFKEWNNPLPSKNFKGMDGVL